MGDEDRVPIYTTYEQARATALWTGVVLLCVGVLAAYFLWPAGITDLPLGVITFGALLRAIGSALVLAVFGALAWVMWTD
jgi:hypothetical protein